MPAGRPPKQPPCPKCGIRPVCYKWPYHRCRCGRFVLEAGSLRPVRESKPSPPCPECGGKLYARGRAGSFNCKRGCGLSFSLVGGELVALRQKRAVVDREAMTADEYESLVG